METSIWLPRRRRRRLASAPRPRSGSLGTSSATPQGSTTPRVVLSSYTNDGQGTIGADDSIKRWYVHRLTWAVIDYGGTCQVSGNAPVPSGSPPTTPIFSHACLTISFIDALTGADLGSMDEFGRGTHDVPTG